MTLLIVLISVFAHLAVALVTSRYLVGVWAYNEWERKGYGIKFESWTPYDIGDKTFGAIILCLFAWPVMALYVMMEGRGRFAIAPKHYRREKTLREKEERFRALEAEFERELSKQGKRL